MENNQFEEDRLFFVNQMEKFMHQEMFPEALDMAKDRLLRFPFDIDALASSNLALLEMGRIEESRDILRELENDITKLSYIFLQAADAYREKGLIQDAVLFYQKFVFLNPLSENSREVAEKIALLQGQESQDLEANESDGADVSKPEFYTITLADLYIRQGHQKMAAEILAEIIKREPANVQARVKLDILKASLTLKSSSGNAVTSKHKLIDTLSCWLDNIGRLKKHAT